MPTIPADTLVQLVPGADARLRYLPPQPAQLVVAIEAAALKAPRSPLTTVIAVHHDQIVWVGSIDEAMVATSINNRPNARSELTALLLTDSPRCFEIVRPGWLRTHGAPIQDTVYQKDRPWIVIGESAHCGLLAVPLNDAGAGPRGHYQHYLNAGELDFVGSKDSTAELAHIWSFPATLPAAGQVRPAAQAGLAAAVKGYFPGRPFVAP